jgi:hypothetical protein
MNEYGQFPSDHIPGNPQLCHCFQCRAEIERMNESLSAQLPGWPGRLLTREEMLEIYPTDKMTFARIARRAGVTGTAYGIRKAVSIWLRKEGAPEWDIKGMLGHAIGGETERYAHYRPEYMKAAATAIERLLVEIRPYWLASYLPVPVSDVPRETQVAVVNGDFGARDRDRTCDPYHVKALHLEDFQTLKPANDD